MSPPCAAAPVRRLPDDLRVDQLGRPPKHRARVSPEPPAIRPSPSRRHRRLRQGRVGKPPSAVRADQYLEWCVHASALLVTSKLSFDGNRILLRLNSLLVETQRSLSDHDRDGGHPVLNFVNTLGGVRGRHPKPTDELLHDYGDLLAWSRFMGTLDGDAAERLARRARRRPSEAAAALKRALDLRARFDRVFRSLAEGAEPARSDLDVLRDEAVAALAHGRLVAGEDGFRWSWPDPGALEAPLWPLARAAVELLTEGPLERVRGCARCRWLFLDESRNRSRRWCSMEGCGTDAKKERYVERRRARRAAARR
jgi:predicted RNA-binding Zn ribbon-like protein